MLLTSHLVHPQIEQLFSDAATTARWVQVEVALAQVQGQLGVIGVTSAEKITKALSSFQPDLPALETAMQLSGVPIAALVKQLRSHVGPPHGNAVHFGATTQDIMDTALVLQLRAALVLIQQRLDQSIKNLAALTDKHRSTVMAGRTHSQQAVPITFGLKTASWLAPLIRQRDRLTDLRPRLLVVQLGGAAGTLSAMGADGLRVQQALASALDLATPIAPWHAQRDTLVELANWLTMTTGALGKMAQDIILLAQSEVGELRESNDPTRGGSSTMPQKRNPMVSEAIITIHRNNVGQLATLHNAMLHAHERATDSWQAEWQALPAMLSRTAAALDKAAWLAQNMAVDVAQMAANVAASNGLMLAEAVSFALAQHMPRGEAKQLVKAAIETVLTEKRHLIDVVQARVDLPLDWHRLRNEQNYLGSAEKIIGRILNSTTLPHASHPAAATHKVAPV